MVKTPRIPRYIVAVVLAAAIAGAFFAGIGMAHPAVTAPVRVDHTVSTYNDGFTDGMRNAHTMTPAQISAWLNGTAR